MPNPEIRPVSHLKIPLLWAFYYLKNEYTFENAIKDIIRKKGDTDNNAAIIGALLGAAYGVEGIPSELIDKVMRLETNRGLYTPKHSLK
jgi:ADP-ribosylglycohydrolase